MSSPMTDLISEDSCPDCLKPRTLCVCAGIEPFDNRIELVILQHPQEQDRDLGTARLALRHFKKARLIVGLSWPNLTRVLGRPAEPGRWGTLYLGPARLAAEAPPIAALNRQGPKFSTWRSPTARTCGAS